MEIKGFFKKVTLEGRQLHIDKKSTPRGKARRKTFNLHDKHQQIKIVVLCF